MSRHEERAGTANATVELEGEKKILLVEAHSRNRTYLNLLSLCSRLGDKVQENLHVFVFHVLNLFLCVLVCFSPKRKEGWGG